MKEAANDLSCVVPGWVTGWTGLKVEVDKDSYPHLRWISPPWVSFNNRRHLESGT